MAELEKAGKYEILRRIGEGGFGVVYQGRDPFIKRQVAIKTCSSSHEETRRRFLREAEIGGGIEHPNITIIYDFGYEGETPYLVQEFLSGEDLDEKIGRRESIPLTTKLDYLLQTAQGLGFAHEHGITHRDIKPSNLRILDDDRVKIMDFGIAKLAKTETQLTQTGTTLGTPAYLSPEQLRGDVVDQRSDVYSYGVLAYELLTYKRMFGADNISALFFQILNQKPPSLTELWSDCPPELDLLIQQCVAKNPVERIQNFRDVVVSLQRVIEQVRANGLDFSVTGAGAPPPLPSSTELPRQQAMTAARNQIEGMLESGDLKRAARALIDAQESFGNALPFRTLHDRLRQLQTASQPLEDSAHMTIAVTEIREWLAAGALEQAEAAHANACGQLGDGPSLIALGRQIRVQQRIREGRELMARGQLEEAAAAVQRAQELDPDNPEVSSVLKLLEAGRAGEAKTAFRPAPHGSTVSLTDLRPAAEREAATATAVPTHQRTPSSVAVPLSGAGAASRSIRWKPMALAAAALLALILAGVAVVRWLGGDPTTGVAAGTFLLSATPWAEVTGIVDADGVSQPLPSIPFTPLRLQLPHGEYQVTLRHPAVAEEQTVTLAIGGETDRQTVVLDAADSAAYFRDLGW
ncbi:MAG TPA: protein kinase [Thermoanaerobaculia bacterium]|nr:protein kinase [Thermoanaerobaculia bacterium]